MASRCQTTLRIRGISSPQVPWSAESRTRHTCSLYSGNPTEKRCHTQTTQKIFSHDRIKMQIHPTSHPKRHFLTQTKSQKRNWIQRNTKQIRICKKHKSLICGRFIYLYYSILGDIIYFIKKVILWTKKVKLPLLFS